MQKSGTPEFCVNKQPIVFEPVWRGSFGRDRERREALCPVSEGLIVWRGMGVSLLLLGVNRCQL